ncbi:MAG: ABC transporter ATP-binding protein [Rhodospirillum sp.]|nr:ABC transporter ATP-binding protein [Rhodospirillum sp.]MCF8490894.1 ABC transporter ATP-binding protein [Rhodospirillum sp.]
MSHLEIRGLSKQWGGITAVKEVSLIAERGSFTVLLGPSGCGKSTLLRMVAGLEEPSAGHILIDGRDVAHVDPAKRGISMVFQSYALFPHLTVAENITFGLRVRKVPKAERNRRLVQVAELVDLSAYLDRRPAQLSGGQRQRVALARAVIAEHAVCLMDEPLSNLDAKLRHAMRMELRALQRRLGMTVLYVTHDQTEAMSMADQVALMNGGTVVQSGPPEVLYKDPATTFAARFLGAPPMNILPLRPVMGGMALAADPLDRPLMRATLPDGCALGLRPEDLILAPNAPQAPGLPVSVISEDYHGADTVLGLRITSTGSADPHDPKGEILVRLPGRVSAERQGIQRLSWRDDAARLFGPDGKKRDPSPRIPPPQGPAQEPE